jgi:RND family efflux transporter MFP subunit
MDHVAKNARRTSPRAPQTAAAAPQPTVLDAMPRQRRRVVPPPENPPAARVPSIADAAPRQRVVPFVITLAAVVLAFGFGKATWNIYMVSPWTRDATVRAYVVTIAPEVAGRIVQLPIADNQLVHKGDLLMQIDPTNYKIAVSLAEAAVRQTQINAQNVAQEAQRRQKLTTLEVTVEEKETYESNAAAAQAQYQQAAANLDQAKVNLERTEIHSPVNGWVTNLSVQFGDYATVGQNEISLVDADSFWVDAYFEETSLGSIGDGNAANIKLMDYSEVVHGHVAGVARGINVANAQPNGQGLASVNPIFTWVRLAQRIPVRIRIDDVPDGVRLVAGMTATVQIDLRPLRPN